MIYLHLLDNTSPKWVKEVSDKITKFYESTGVEVKHLYKEVDFTNLPFEIYYGDYPGIARWYLNQEVQKVFNEYGYTVDRVNFWVGHDNWHIREKVWGWNMGSTINGYDVHQCMIDTRSSRSAESKRANTFGTLYHEGMHANKHAGDRYETTGFTVERKVSSNLKLSKPVTDWQSEVVHGEHPDFDYIRLDNNKEALEAISIKLAFASIKRRELMGLNDKPAIHRILALMRERVRELGERISQKVEVMKPLTKKEEKEIIKEYKKI